jgi:hypothetical protein
VASALRSNECWRTEEKAPLPAAQEEGHPPTREIIAARRCKRFIIAQIAPERDNLRLSMQQKLSEVAGAPLISCQNAGCVAAAPAAFHET